MAARTGTPAAVIHGLDGAPDWELHKAEADALLAVCGTCGFQFDADHRIEATSGGVRYECPRCMMELAVERLQDNAAAALMLKEQLAHQLDVHERELTHLREQNALLKRESVALRAVALAACAVVKKAADNGTGEGQWTVVQLLTKALEHAGFTLEATHD